MGWELLKEEDRAWEMRRQTLSLLSRHVGGLSRLKVPRLGLEEVQIQFIDNRDP